jgi:predicted nuclease of predicted toxin-antitoxin system
LNFVADESVDHPIVLELRKVGHRVLAIAEVAAQSRDADVLRLAKELDAVLLTNDKDFGELV